MVVSDEMFIFATVYQLIVSAMKSDREKRAARVTLYGAAINIILVIFKLIAGIIGQSSAMIADGIHSLSDLLTDRKSGDHLHEAQPPAAGRGPRLRAR